MLPLCSATVLSTCWINEYAYEGRNGQENSRKTVCPWKNHKKPMRQKPGSIRPAVNESPPGCLKTHCQGFTEPSVLEEKTREGTGSHPVPIPHTRSSASNLNQVTIMFCLAISNSSNLVSCFPSGIPMTCVCLHSRQRDLWKSKSDHMTTPTSCSSVKHSNGFLARSEAPYATTAQKPWSDLAPACFSDFTSFYPPGDC